MDNREVRETGSTMSKRVKYGLPGLTGSFVLSAGVMCWWCRDPAGAAILLLVLSVVAAATTAFIVTED